jgi:hypothetical protein
MFNIKALRIYIVILLPVLLLFAPLENIKAQCYSYNRIYANNEEVNSNVTNSSSGLGDNTDVKNAAYALGSNLVDFSSIKVPSVSSTRYQRLKFPQTFTRSEPIHIKLGSTLDFTLMEGFEVELRAYNGGSAVGTGVKISASSLINFFSGENTSDVIIPSPGASYDAVQITVKGGLLPNGKINVYAAYINEAVTNGDCNEVVDLTIGTTSGIFGGLTTVKNPSNAIDNNPLTYAELNQNLGVAGYVHLTALYSSTSVAGDSVSVTFKVPGTPLLNAQIFSQLSVITYLGNTQVAVIPADASQLGIRLLDATNHIYQFTYAVNLPFDRISIQAGGTVTALPQVHIYDIKRLIPKPKLLIDGAIALSKTFCFGLNTILTVDPIQTCTIYNWYNSAVGGTPVYTGSSYVRNALPVGNYNYYIEAVRNGCTATVSQRTLATILVNPLPTIILAADPSICIENLKVLLPYKLVTGIPTSYSIIWGSGSLANVVNATFPSISPIIIPMLSSASVGSHAGTITLKNANGCTSAPIDFSVIINPKLTLPILNIISN